MKKDTEVKLLMQERRKGTSQRLAAARAGMGERTARKYEQAGELPSQLKRPHTWATRDNPFEQDWPWVVAQLERDPALQGSTLFALLCEQHPSRYRPTQLRTLQRHIARWRAVSGPEQEVIFEQRHQPGERAQSDFTHMEDLGVTIAGEPFPHMVYHFVLTYSNAEAASICFSESFEALAEGIEKALWQIGGVPEQHRTDHLSAAVRHLDKSGQEDWTKRYDALMAHYGMQPTWNNTGVAHENGDVEQSHFRFKEAVDQALRVRGSREFADRATYTRFLVQQVKQRNATRQVRWAEEQAVLRPLPASWLALCRELRMRVSRFSNIQVLRNTYSVPSRLIGTTLLVRVRSETLEVYRGTSHLLSMPRLLGHGQHRIDYRHVIWSLVRKPGAFAQYRYHDDLFPSLAFRRIYDALCVGKPQRADRDYVRILHLAASTSEAEVELALGLLLDQGSPPSFDAVRDLVRAPVAARLPVLGPVEINMAVYDRLPTAAHA